jgi:hypothetical protein
MPNITKIKLELKDGETFDKLYKENALIVIGCAEESIESLVNKFLDEYEEGAPYCGGLKDDVTVYHTIGEVINSIYNLHGDNAFQSEIGFALIPLEYFKDTGKLAMFRLMMDPSRLKWFDDFVDNNLRREKEYADN